MSDSAPVRPARWWHRLFIVVPTLLVGAWVGFRSQPGSNISHELLRLSAPVAVDIEYEPQIKREANATILEGPARYRFKNLTDHPVQIAFPPHHVFGINDHSTWSHAELPAFAREKRIVEIPANGEKVFESPARFLQLGGTSRFMKGGPGWLAFVFESPKETPEKPEGEFCIGTIISRYTVKPQ